MTKRQQARSLWVQVFTHFMNLNYGIVKASDEADKAVEVFFANKKL